MAAAPGTLGDFFGNKKKKVKGSNLNVAKPEAKVEAKKGKKNAEEEGWEEQEVVASTMKVEAAGKLIREEDKVEEDTSAPAWGTLKNKGESAKDLNERKYPSLSKAMMGSSNINIDDGSNGKINIETSKNAFAAFGSPDSDDDGPKRPTHIKPSMVQKKKGEFEKVALQREVNKYTAKPTKKKAKTNEDDSSEEEDESEEETEEVAAPVQKKNVPKKKFKVEKEEPAEENEEAAAVEEDLKIVPDLAASKAKYGSRRKMEEKVLSREELEEDKENRPKATGGKKKKNMVNEEEEYSKGKKLMVWED